MLTVNGCCGCCDLKSGSKAIAIFYLVMSILATITLVIILAEFSIIDDAYHHASSDPNFSTPAGEAAVETTLNVILAMFIIGLLLYVGYIVVCSFLIAGINQGRPGFMVPWMVVQCIGIVFSFINIIAMGVVLFWPAFGLYLCELALSIYFVIVVYSYYIELKGSPGSIQSPGGGPPAYPKV